MLQLFSEVLTYNIFDKNFSVMVLLKNFLVFSFILCLFSCKSDKTKEDLAEDPSPVSQSEDIVIHPVNHATFVLESKTYTFYIDPVGGYENFSKFKKPDFILITDIHGDHLSIETLKTLDLSNTTLVVPKAVADKLPDNSAKSLIILNNGSDFKLDNLKIEAIPMYNLREEALKFHPKGRGNGYVINVDNQRIYISGDTEDIPEMRQLKDIDIAFVCMNLPYTMTAKSAASAVLEFKPKKIYPYHYKGKNEMSDINFFVNEIVSKNSNIKVVVLNWYM